MIETHKTIIESEPGQLVGRYEAICWEDHTVQLRRIDDETMTGTCECGEIITRIGDWDDK
jgi:hypothetical protein